MKLHGNDGNHHPPPLYVYLYPVTNYSSWWHHLQSVAAEGLGISALAPAEVEELRDSSNNTTEATPLDVPPSNESVPMAPPILDQHVAEDGLEHSLAPTTRSAAKAGSALTENSTHQDSNASPKLTTEAGHYKGQNLGPVSNMDSQHTNLIDESHSSENSLQDSSPNVNKIQSPKAIHELSAADNHHSVFDGQMSVVPDASKSAATNFQRQFTPSRHSSDATSAAGDDYDFQDAVSEAFDNLETTIQSPASKEEAREAQRVDTFDAIVDSNTQYDYNEDAAEQPGETSPPEQSINLAEADLAGQSSEPDLGTGAEEADPEPRDGKHNSLAESDAISAVTPSPRSLKRARSKSEENAMLDERQESTKRSRPI